MSVMDGRAKSRRGIMEGSHGVDEATAIGRSAGLQHFR